MTRRDLTHEHEWHLDHDTPCEYYGTDLFVRERCEWVEITGSTTSERLDETFYETGAECAATRTTVFEVHIPAIESGEIPDDGRVAEQIDRRVEERLTGEHGEPEVLDWHDWRDGVDKSTHTLYVDVHSKPEPYVVEFEYAKTNVREDWS